MHHRNIILIGFMGSGKTEVGKTLAGMVGMEFVDTDELIETRTGQTIVQIFKTKGEAWFREFEKGVVAEVSRWQRKVIGTGGGVPTFAENLKALRETGWLVYLKAKPETLWQRCSPQQNRPLLQVPDPLQRIRELLRQREPHYRQADLIINTDSCSTSEAAEQIAKWWKVLPEEARMVTVDLGERSYPIVIGGGLVLHTPLLIERVLPPAPLALITDEQVGEIYAERLRQSFSICQPWNDLSLHIASVPSGEKSKTLSQAAKLYDFLADKGFGRDAILVALGGGVVGDLAGFVAATYMRGISFVQVPTTLLAQVDASVGGKVAVNHPKAKNLIGCFYQPQLVLIDTDTLRTLPPRELRAGLAEVVKYAVIADGDLFEFLEQNAEPILNLDKEALQYIIFRSCRIKASVVETDERETGLRAILNYGHTFAHALESVTGYSKFLHGEAVAIGMTADAFLAEKMGLCDACVPERQTQLLKRLRLPTKTSNLDTARLEETMLLDKKRRGKVVRFVLPTRIGEVLVTKEPVPVELLRATLKFMTNDNDE